MAMNKKEKAALEDARTAAALRWTAPVSRDVFPPTGEGETTGWDFNKYAVRIFPAWSKSCQSGEECNNRRTVARNPMFLYSTKLLAAQALRYAIEQDMAKELRAVDLIIEDIIENSK